MVAAVAAAEIADSWLLLWHCTAGSGTLGTGSQGQVVEPPAGIVAVTGTVYWTTDVTRRNIDLLYSKIYT